jgi:FkbM family methyltransferase
MKTLLKKIPGVATMYRRLRDWRILRAKPRSTPFGFKIIGTRAMQSGNYEVKDTETFRKLVSGVDVVINAGAHVGYYCLHALAMGKRVVAFEPMPVQSAVLCKNIFINGWGDRAEVFKLALGDKVGIREMYGLGTGASLVKGWAGFSAKSPTFVPVSTLDTVLGERFRGQRVLVLADVEGSEYELLLGAKRLLTSEPKPIWMVEIALYEHQPRGGVNKNFLPTFDIFWERGYEAYGIAAGEDRMKLLNREEIRENPLAVKSALASSNFIFIYAQG